MTTTINVHVNGNYRATVKHSVGSGGNKPAVKQPDTIVNPQETKQLNFVHGQTNSFVITEEYLGAKATGPDSA